MPYALALVLLVPMTVVAADPVVNLPATLQVGAGEFLTIRADTPGKVVRWRAVDPGLTVFPANMLKDERSTVVIALKPGRYRLWCWTSVTDTPTDRAECLIVVGDAPPPPPGPPPNPPDPPTPPPNPPDPTDPFVKQVIEAYRADPGAPADKKTWLVAYAGLLKAAAGFVEEGDTIGNLLADFQSAGKGVMPPGSLPGVQRLCVAKVFALAGDDSERKIDKDLKVKLVDLFTQLSRALAVEGRR